MLTACSSQAPTRGENQFQQSMSQLNLAALIKAMLILLTLRFAPHVLQPYVIAIHGTTRAYFRTGVPPATPAEQVLI
jgi:hypothetical protein